MKTVSFVLSVMAFCLFLFLLNFWRYIKTAIYHAKYQTNCNANHYGENISFYHTVTRLFDKADVNQIDIRNYARLSEHLEEPGYERAINICFEKAEATFHDRCKRPWYIIKPVSTYGSLWVNSLFSVVRWVLLFLLNQVASSFLETLGIGDILLDILCSKFPWLNTFLSRFFLS